MAALAEDLSPEQLRTLLEDTQASLAAALARIEAFRIRERQLVDELATLRKQMFGDVNAEATAIAASTAAAHTAAAAATRAGAPASAAEYRPMNTCSIEMPQTRNVPAAAFTAVGTNAPLYVTSLSGANHAATLYLRGDRGQMQKVNCSIIIAKDYIDFVELRARIKQDDFIGISSIKESRSQGALALDVLEGIQGLSVAAGGGGGSAGATPTSWSPAAAGFRQQQQAGEPKGRWGIHVRGVPKPVEFETSQTTRATLHKHTERWLGNEDTAAGDSDAAAAAKRQEAASELAVPKSLVPGNMSMRLVGEPSHIMAAPHISALSGAVPPLERLRDWGLSYSTRVHGISLTTLYRKMLPGNTPTITVVKDNYGHVFGCYTAHAWHVAPRFYGTGETFVFQLQPSLLHWSWRAQPGVKNDFFQYSTPDCLAVGALGHFALHLDQELLQGSSGTCGTFGSPCLAGREDFKVVVVEVWQAVT